MKASHNDLYQVVTAQVIEALEKGTIIWKQPWNSLGMPRNIINGHQYRGWNVFYLKFICHQRNYPTPCFLTYHQVQKAGGNIIKGEKGATIVYLAVIDHPEQPTIEVPALDKTASNVHWVPGCHTVFNIAQTTGIQFPQIESLFRNAMDNHLLCKRTVAGMPLRPLIRHQGDRAFYHPVNDTVTMPDRGLFCSDATYYKALFHELAHSTGHGCRLNRKELCDSRQFGDQAYSREELTAELTAAYLTAFCGIQEPDLLDNSAAYIRYWLQALCNDKKLMLNAASGAQAAADYILTANPLCESSVIALSTMAQNENAKAA